MADLKAVGQLVWELSVNNVKARKALQTMRADIRNTNKEWKTSYDLAKQSGQMSDALKIKIDGLGRAYDKSNEYLKTQQRILDNTVKSGNANALVVEKLKTKIDQTKLSMQRMSNQQDIANRNYIRAKTNIDNVTKAHQNSRKASEDYIQALKSEGREQEASKNKAELYKRELINLQAELGAEKKALKEMNSEGYANTDMYKKQQSRISQLRSEYSRIQDQQKFYSVGLEKLNEKNQKNISSMKATVKMLDDEGRHFKARTTEVKTLKRESEILIDQRERERQELSYLGDKYGSQSSKYVNQSRKVSDLTGQIVRLNKRTIDLNRSTGGTYGLLDKFGDHVSVNAKRNERLGNSLQKIGYGMSGISAIMVGSMVDGTKESFKLQSSYKRTQNLIDATNEESTSAVAKNMEKAKKQNIELSSTFGESQKSLADTQQVLVKRGYTSNQMLGAMSPLLKASTASGDKLNDVVKVSTSALESFGMRANSSSQMLQNTNKAVNTIAYASDKSASSFQSTGIAMSYVGSTAHTAGVSIDQTASAIGILSNNGVKLLPSQLEMVA